MNRNHAAFFQTPQGSSFKDALEQPLHKYGFALVSLLGQPAIAAAAWQLDGLLQGLPPGRRDFVKQACGGLIGDMMIALGASRATSRSGRIRSARVKTSKFISRGAVWIVPPDAPKRLSGPLIKP